MTESDFHAGRVGNFALTNGIENQGPLDMEPPQQSRQTKGDAQSATSRYQEHHYAVAEIAAMWNLSEDTVRRLFKDEPGVLVIRDWQPRGRKRRYTTLRIPESVVARVHSTMSLSKY